jgi:hypothetical protein
VVLPELVPGEPLDEELLLELEAPLVELEDPLPEELLPDPEEPERPDELPPPEELSAPASVVVTAPPEELEPQAAAPREAQTNPHDMPYRMVHLSGNLCADCPSRPRDDRLAEGRITKELQHFGSESSPSRNGQWQLGPRTAQKSFMRYARRVKPYPTRLVRREVARARHGADRLDALAQNLREGDGLADAAVERLEDYPREAQNALIGRILEEGVDRVPEAPEPLRALVAQVSRVPFWVDEARMARASAAFLRSGLLGGLVLGARSLVGGYCSPAGNKPLVFSGRLERDAGRRLAETGRFVQAVSVPGGMRRQSDGFKIAVRVRLMHAAVRRGLQRSDVWREDDWGVPINQADMAGTVLLFSMILQDGLAKLGMAPTPQEREDLLHLWRYVAFVMGVCDELRCATLAEARALWDLLTGTQAPPDDDSRALARALIEFPLQAARSPEERRRAARTLPIAYAVSRHLLGDELAEALRYPRTPAIFAVKAFQQVNRRAGPLWSAIPGVPFGTVKAGVQYWDRVVGGSPAARAASFPLP